MTKRAVVLTARVEFVYSTENFINLALSLRGDIDQSGLRVSNGTDHTLTLPLSIVELLDKVPEPGDTFPVEFALSTVDATSAPVLRIDRFEGYQGPLDDHSKAEGCNAEFYIQGSTEAAVLLISELFAHKDVFNEALLTGVLVAAGGRNYYPKSRESLHVSIGLFSKFESTSSVRRVIEVRFDEANPPKDLADYVNQLVDQKLKDAKLPAVFG